MNFRNSMLVPILLFVLDLLSIAGFVLSFLYIGDNLGMLVVMGFLILTFTIFFIIKFISGICYLLCVKKGSHGKGCVLEVLHDSTRFGVSHYLVVSFEMGNGIKRKIKIPVERDTANKYSRGMNVPLLTYKSYALYDGKKEDDGVVSSSE